MPLVRMSGGGDSSSKTYLYKDGIEEVVFVNRDSEGGYSASFSKRTDSMFLTVTGRGSSDHGSEVAGTQAKIDLTNYKKLVVEYVASNIVTSSNSGILFTDDAPTRAYTVSSAYKISSGSATFTFDISSINGTKYISFIVNGMGGGASTLTIKKIWLEKAEQKFLYKGGTWKVSYDNDGHTHGSSEAYSPNGWTIGDLNIQASPTSWGANNSILTESIDLGEYSKLCVQYGNGTIKKIDISDVISNAYIVLTAWKRNTLSFWVYVASQKDNYSIGAYKSVTVQDNLTAPIIVTNVWLEK